MLIAGTICRAQVSFTGTQFALTAGALATPTGMTVDGKGNLYIADQGNNRIVELPILNGIWQTPTVILTGLSAPNAVAADWDGNLYVTDTGNGQVLLLPITPQGLGSSQVLATGFANPAGICVDWSGNVFVADTGNGQIVEIPHVAGAYASPLVIQNGFANPMAVAIDAAKTLYVADTGNNRVLRLSLTANGYASPQVIARGLASPTALAVDKLKNLYIADTGNNRIVEEPWIAGAGRYNSSVLIGSNWSSPAGVAVSWGGDVYVADTAISLILDVVAGTAPFPALPVTPAGSTQSAIPEIQTFSFHIAAGTTLGSVSIFTQGVTGLDFVAGPQNSCLVQTYAVASYCGIDVAFNPLGSGQRPGAIVLYDPNGNPLATAYLAGTGLQPQAAFFPGTVTVLGSGLSGPSGVAVDGSGNVYIADTGNNQVVQIAAATGVQTPVPIYGLNNPMGLDIDGAGNLYVVSNGNDKILKLPWTGIGFGPQFKVGNGFYGPSTVAVDAQGNLFIADTLDNEVFKMPWNGSGYSLEIAPGNYRRLPVGVAVAPNGNLFFAEPYINNLIELPYSGTGYTGFNIQVYLHLEGANFPSAVAIDGNNNMYVLDSNNNRVVLFPWTGSGFGTQITVATGFNSPMGMTLDLQGNLYIADTGNNQVVKMNLSLPGSLNFADTYLGSTSADSARTVILANVGNQPLNLTSVSYPTDFPQPTSAFGQSSTLCTGQSSVLPGYPCSLPVSFTPTQAGSPLSEALVITDDSLGAVSAQQSIGLSGNAWNQASQTISMAQLTSLSYGTPPIPLTATASSGLPVVYQVLSGPGRIIAGGQALQINGVGTLVLQVSQPGNAGFAPASALTMGITILPAVLTVSATSINATYGAVPVANGYSISGFVRGETPGQVLSGRPAVVSSVSRSASVGSYPINITQGSLAAANYTFAFASGTLTIQPALLTVRARSASVLYGAPPPTLKYIVGGFVNGDSPRVLQGAPSLACALAQGASAGIYSVTIAPGTLNAANYQFQLTGAAVTVRRAQLRLAANNASAKAGGNLPALGFSVRGLVNGDTLESAIMGQPQLATTAPPKPKAGSYPILVSQGTLSATNYDISFGNGKLYVVP